MPTVGLACVMTRDDSPHTLDGVDLEHHWVAANGVRLHVVAAGPSDGPVVLLLHGFPEFWYGWRSQIPALARAGYRVWAPDGRGYGLSDKPPSVYAYALDTLADDAHALVQATGRSTASVVGHDWGAAVAWRLAERHAPSVAELVILNVPHPFVFARTLRTSARQRRRSAYVAFFQLPLLPEALLRAGDHRALARSLETSSRPGTFSAADMAMYRWAWSQPGALKGMLDWYRAALRAPVRYAAPPRVRVPTTMLWGARDAFLLSEMAAASVALCDDGRLQVFDEATHWLQHEEPEAVNRSILSFLGR